ncbi:nucleotidyltransferase family protein [Halioxenophilus aromaticivorans]|uniref:Nucleotidyltransferase family protein n=1 Tax=Halioxenophilus aromaticivorans TaxID=1306992 RepID=A0AAV3U685_9ALTE
MACKHGLALVMAAGASRRFGHEDKRMAKVGGMSLLARSWRNAAAGFGQALLAAKPGDDLGLLDLDNITPESVYYCQQPQLGLGSNIAQAVDYIHQHFAADSFDFLAVVLADMPLIKVATLETLAAAGAVDKIVRPSWQGRPGHPVLFGRQFWPQLRQLQGDQGGVGVLQANPQSVQEIALEDAAVCWDIDTPEALQQAEKQVAKNS